MATLTTYARAMPAPFWNADPHPHNPHHNPQAAHSALVRLKVVPGSSRDQIVGLLGDRLKVKVAAAPEHGKANAAVINLLAKALDLPPSAVTVESGHTRPEKTLRVTGASPPSLDALTSPKR